MKDRAQQAKLQMRDFRSIIILGIFKPFFHTRLGFPQVRFKKFFAFNWFLFIACSNLQSCIIHIGISPESII